MIIIAFSTPFSWYLSGLCGPLFSFAPFYT